MTAIYTHNDYHLGDQLIHLNFLRRVAASHPNVRFVHACHEQLISQLTELVVDLPNISLRNLKDRVEGSIDCWKNRKDRFYGHPDRDNWVTFHLEHFDLLAKDMGVDNPIRSPRDLLFDYPMLDAGRAEPFDFLIINSMPFSNQLHIQPNAFDPLIGRLMDKGYTLCTTARCSYAVPCTQPFSVTAVGCISRYCKYIVGVATGPIWPTFNVHNYDTVALRVILLESERIYLTPNTEHASSVMQAADILGERGLL